MKYTTGIYQIKNTRTGERYIGSTNNFKRRKKEHFFALKNGKHQTRIQLAWNSEPNKRVFVFEVIVVYPVEGLLDLEQKCLDELNPEYNLSPFARGIGPFYYKLTVEEQVAFSEKMSRVMSSDSVSKKLSEAGIRRFKKPGAKDEHQVLLKEVFSRSEVVEACRNGAISRWSDPAARLDYSILMAEVNNRPDVTKRRTEAIIKALGRSVMNVTTGEVFTTLAEAKRAYDLKSSNSIRDCCSGRTAITRLGHVWRYLDENGESIPPRETPKPTRTSESRSMALKKIHLNRSPEEYIEIGRKSWETRRKNKEKALES